MGFEYNSIINRRTYMYLRMGEALHTYAYQAQTYKKNDKEILWRGILVISVF